MRIPFSSLRYKNVDPQTWGIMLYRNYPRDRHYQFFSATLPRGGNCFVCHANTLDGPRAAAGRRPPRRRAVRRAPAQSARPRGDGPASPLVDDAVQAARRRRREVHAERRQRRSTSPSSPTSRRSSPTRRRSRRTSASRCSSRRSGRSSSKASICSQTPIQAVYTRTITAPSWGGRITGKDGGVRYTALVAEDAGGGSVVLPGPNGSSLAPQDFASTVFVGRAKRDIGRSFVGVLVTDREGRDGDGAQPRRRSRFSVAAVGQPTSITGQWLVSDTRTPNRPDLAAEWTGQSLTRHAGQLQWSHNTTHLDCVRARTRTSATASAPTPGSCRRSGYREAYGERRLDVPADGLRVAAAHVRERRSSGRIAPAR